IYWKQKSRKAWLKVGDKNTNFFHALVKYKRNSNYISRIVSADGSECSDQASIRNEAISYFSRILGGEYHSDWVNQNSLLQNCNRLLDAADNAALMAPFSMEDICFMVLSMEHDKVPGAHDF
ncbi:hypothetical protein KI387_032844, partial [Taxus chinensis]